MNSEKIILLLGLLLILTIIGFLIAYLLLVKKIKSKNQYAVFLVRKTTRLDYVYICYRYLSQLFFTKRKIQKIKKRYDILYPGDEKRAAKETMRLMFIVCFTFIAASIYILFGHLDLYSSILLFVLLYIFQNEVIYLVTEKKDINLLIHLDQYISDVRHEYFAHGMIEEAIYEAMDRAKDEMKLHAEKIYQVLTSDEKEAEILLYHEQIPNRFLRIFLAICSMTIDFGDKEVDGQTVFSINLKDLKREIMIEKLKREKMNYLFSGLTFLTLMPLPLLSIAKGWAVGNIAELYTWYNGTYGIVSLCGLFGISLFIYNILKELKEMVMIDKGDHIILEYLVRIPFISRLFDNILSRNYGKTMRYEELLRRSGEKLTVKEFYIKSCITCIIVFVSGIFLFQGIHINKRSLALNYVEQVTSISSSATPTQEEELKRLVKKYTLHYKDSKTVNSERIAKEMMSESMIKNSYLLKLLGQEVEDRVRLYQKEFFHWYELFFSVVFAVLGYFYPLIQLKYKEKLVYMQMEDEVIQFQSVILMLVYFDKVTTDTILEWMEKFSIIFKESLEECLSHFAFGEKEALETLKEKESFEPFVRIIENLEQADLVGIQKAFNEIAVDRKNYQEKRKQDNEIYVKNKSAIAQFLAFIPLASSIIFYLIVPMVGYSLMQLMLIAKEFTNYI